MSAKAFFSLSVSPSSQHALQNTMHTTMMIFFLRKRDENATFFQALLRFTVIYTSYSLAEVEVELLSKVGLSDQSP